MNLASDAAWTASFYVSAVYFICARRPHRIGWFNWANFWGACVLVPYDLLHGAVAAAALSVCFGLIGLWGVIRG